MSASPLLESRDLALMRALQEHGGVTRAAKALGLTQSAVSHQLARLESKLGVALFGRKGRGLAITPTGKRLVDGGNAVLDQLLVLERSLTPQRPTRIRVTTQCTTAYDWLAPVLGRFGRSHPATRLAVRVECARDPIRALHDDEVDLAICYSSPDEGLVGRRLGDDPFVVVLHAGHRLAKSEVRPAQLRDEIVIVHEVARDELARLGRAWFGARPPTQVIRLPLTEAIIELVATGYGVAMMPRWAARHAQRRADVVVRPFRKRGASRTWRALLRDDDADREDLVVLTTELASWFRIR